MVKNKMKTIDIYVHAMWPSEKYLPKGMPIQKSKVQQYEQALFDQIKQHDDKMIILSTSAEKDQKLVQIAEKYGRDYVQVVSPHCVQENKSSEHMGFIKYQDRTLIEEIAESESVIVNGFIYGLCPTDTIEQALFMRNFGQYLPQCMISRPLLPSYAFYFSTEEIEKHESNKNTPQNWRYGVAAACNKFDVVPPKDKRVITLSMTDQDTKIYLLNKTRPIEKGFQELFFKKFKILNSEEAAILKQSIFL